MKQANFKAALLNLCICVHFHVLKHSLLSLSISQVTFYNVVPLISVSERSSKCRSFCLLFIIVLLLYHEFSVADEGITRHLLTHNIVTFPASYANAYAFDLKHH